MGHAKQIALSVAASLATSVGLLGASAGGRVVGPSGSFCFEMESGWVSDGYDVNSDATTIHHGVTTVRLRLDADCWLMANLSDPSLRDIEDMLLGIGRERSLSTLDGRFGSGRLALYANYIDEATGATASPVIACVALPSGWLVVQGAVASADEAALRRILERTTVNCGGPDSP